MSPIKRLSIFANVALLLVLGRAWAGNDAGKQLAAPEKRTPPVVQAVYVDAPPVMDGKLDDACWTNAARLEGFFVPDVDQQVPEETIGLVCVDDTAIYVGVICKDRTPEDIKAQETRRNGEIWHDDGVELDLDPWHQHGESYAFNVNALGTQCENIPGGSATKIEWRGDWTAATAHTAEGWTCEIAIPFSILRYPPGQSTFGLSLWRGFGRERLWVAYPIMGKTYDRALAADLVGLHPPTFRPRPLLMPYVVADLGESVGSHFDTGLDIQYHMTNGITGLATLNPDFKQIEDVVESVAFSYTPKYLPDPRPFFMTGQGYLPGSLMLYTRNIADFDAGVKLFGTVGNESYGLLDAITLGEQNVFAAQWQHRFDANRDVIFRFLSDREAGGPDSVIYGFDMGRRWPSAEGETNLWMGYRSSLTEGGPGGAHYEVGGGSYQGSGKLHCDWGAALTTRGFQPALGFFYDQNSLGVNASAGVWTHYEKGRLESQGWNVGGNYYPYIHGEGFLRSSAFAERDWDFRSGWRFEISAARAQEYDQDSSGATVSIGWNHQDLYRTGELSLLMGTRAGGDYRYLSFSQGFRPMKPLSVNVSFEYSDLAPPSPDAAHNYQAILTASYDVTPEKCISARVVSNNGGVTPYAAYRQAVRRGTDIYVILGNPSPSTPGFSQRLAIKLVRVF